MSKQSKMQCWEIIQCDKKQNCFHGGNTKRACWEMVEDDDACSFHICVDCLVYLAKNENSLISHHDFCTIMAQRRAKGIRLSKCNFVHDTSH